MEYKYVNAQKLTRCYNEWHAIIAKMQPEASDTVSFSQGEPKIQEGYKYDIIKDAKGIIERVNWSDPDIMSSRKISEIARDLLAIRTSSNSIQNLVDYHDILYFYDLLATSKYKDIEKALHLLYAEGKEMESFILLSHVLKKKYALISYFFFLKDSDKFQVVRPNNAAKRFSLIDAPVSCTLTCTWENYQLYNSVLEEVQFFLSSQIGDTTTLTDAHSFVWMFWMLKSFK